MAATARRQVFRTLVAAGLVAAGCTFTRPRDTDPPADLLARQWVEPDVPPGTYPAVDQATVDGLAAALGGPPPASPAPGPPARALNILCLSAGGKYSAFGAGLLCGWTDNGTRPVFDVVTGSSSGALLATYAFLGPGYDARVRRFFTETRDKDLFCYRPTLDLIRTGALASTRPLQKLIAAEVTEGVLAEIRDAHLAGRRLFVATINTRTKRLTVWDLGAIATGGRPDALELIRKVLLAACSLPGLAPPVEFTVTVNGQPYKEYHGDGGVVTQSFVRFGPLSGGPPGPWLGGSSVYCVTSGKLYGDPAPGRMWLLGRVSSSVSAALYALYRAEMMKTYALCLTSGATFNLATVPQDFPLPAGSMSATTDDMKRLFDLGYRAAIGGIAWRHQPPGSEADEQEVPRAGLTFETR
jgi:hypothetical protein